MVDKGPDKDWLAERKSKYETNLAAGKLRENAQALPRLELIRKILMMWPRWGRKLLLHNPPEIGRDGRGSSKPRLPEG